MSEKKSGFAISERRRAADGAELPARLDGANAAPSWGLQHFLTSPFARLMPPIQRTATGAWRGDLRSGTGQIDSTSGVLQATPFTFATRFENAKGTNPEELIAAAHAACFSMAFSNHLAQAGHTPDEITTRATITLDNGSINKMHLETRGRVPGLDEAAFKEHAEEAEKKCPVSNLLRPGLEITLDAALAG